MGGAAVPASLSVFPVIVVVTEVAVHVVGQPNIRTCHEPPRVGTHGTVGRQIGVRIAGRDRFRRRGWILEEVAASYVFDTAGERDVRGNRHSLHPG